MNLNLKKLKEQPLGYWEEKSYMLAIPENPTQELLNTIFDRVSQIDGVEIKEKHPLTALEAGRMTITYDGEEYMVGFFPGEFSLPEFYLNNSYYFTEDEVEKLRNARMSLTIFMGFNKDSKKSYHLQLKLALAMVPDMLGLLDESAEKMLPRTWVKMTAESKVLPSANDLYIVHAVSNDNGEIWLHTHGLCRCGLTELEILQSDKENYNSHYNLIATLASYLVDKKDNYNGSAYIGILSNRQPVVATYVSWTKGLSEYSNLTLGGENDRKDGHNSRTSIIFLFKSEEDEKNNVLTKVSFFDKLWTDNPLFFISNEETARMKELAMERFSYVQEEFGVEGNNISIKIGLPVDKNNNFEHIWFELLEMDGDRFKAKLLQEPYDISDIRVGDERWFTVKDVTDWVIYTPVFPITPSTAYLLEVSKKK